MAEMMADLDAATERAEVVRRTLEEQGFRPAHVDVNSPVDGMSRRRYGFWMAESVPPQTTPKVTSPRSSAESKSFGDESTTLCRSLNRAASIRDAMQSTVSCGCRATSRSRVRFGSIGRHATYEPHGRRHVSR